MKVNSFRDFRNRYKIDKGYKGKSYDSNFMGTYHNGTKIKGFFNMFHGDKPDIGGFLRSDLDMAEDDQAIYEFIQNAADCKSTKCMIYYDEENFLVINNGRKFDAEGLLSILNIGQSSKRTASDIGRLGIGFKLAHRLVGKQNGIKELLEYKGPIVFSWNRLSQLQKFVSEENIIVNDNWDDKLPYLFKILLTNFPSDVQEVIKDINYKGRVVFTLQELTEMREFIKECLVEIDSSFSQGTITYIRLGEGKKDRLNDSYESLIDGIQYSMNTLRQLNSITINGETISEKELIIENGVVKKEEDVFEELEVEYKDYDVNYAFGFLPFQFDEGGFKEIKALKNAPNFYKYFPMGDEIDGYGIFIHCDSFNIQSNRRELNQGITNEGILPIIAEFICNKLEQYKSLDFDKFKQLYVSLLLSDPKDDWIKESFYSIILDYLQSNIPVRGHTFVEDGAKVIIKNCKTPISLKKIGLSDYYWFLWEKKGHKIICDAAYDYDKLNLDYWNLNDVIENADLDKLNNWLSAISEQHYNQFLKELAERPTKEVENILSSLRIFLFNDARKSWDEIKDDNKYIVMNETLEPIRRILKRLGYHCSTLTMENHPLSDYIDDFQKSDKCLFDDIKNNKANRVSKLSLSQKIALLTAFEKFEDVGTESIKKISLFKNKLNKYVPLEKLTYLPNNAPKWLSQFLINELEYCEEISKYLVPKDKVFEKIIIQYLRDVLEDSTLSDLYDFYHDLWTLEATKKAISLLDAQEDVLKIIEEKLDGDSTEVFIEKLEKIDLNSNAIYRATDFAYRVIKLACSLQKSSIKDHILINGKQLKDYTTGNILSFDCINSNKEKVTYTINVSDVIPNDTEGAIYEKVASMFSAIPNYRFVFSADNANSSLIEKKVRGRLEGSDNVVITPAEYLFILLTRARNNYNNLSNWDGLIHFAIENESPAKTITGILEYAFNNKLTDIIEQYKSISLWRQHIQDKYLFSDNWTLETERGFKEIEQWCQNDSIKRTFLKRLGMHFEDSAEIKRRIKFLNSELLSWDTELSSTPESFLAWAAALNQTYTENQRELLYTLATNAKVSNSILKIEYCENDFSEFRELTSSKYKIWSQSHHLRIYIGDTELPYRILYKNEVIDRGLKGKKHFFPENKHLYVKGSDEQEMVSVLAETYSQPENPFTYADYIAICFDSYEEQKAKDDEIKILKAKVAKLEGQNQDSDEDRTIEYANAVKEFMGEGFEMPYDKVKQEHIITRFRCMMYLKDRYGLSASFNEKDFVQSGNYKMIQLENGTEVHIQGAKYGVWYVSPNIWEDAIRGKRWVCLCVGNRNTDFMIISDSDKLKNIANQTNSVIIRVSGDEYTDNLQTLSRVFPGEFGGGRVQLLLKLKDTPNKDINYMFDAAFKNENNYDGL